jgi:acyl transferase domain-containing protein
MAMRLPGGIKTEDEFWQLMIQKRDAICQVPETRYNVEAFYDKSKSHTLKTRHGCFLTEDPAHFDARFFSISDHEASRMDPQQRRLLEVAWECMESAGQTEWRGKDIGCYVGVYGDDWLDISSKDTQLIDRMHVFTTEKFALANIISYRFDLTGPRLVAIHRPFSLDDIDYVLP